MRRSGRGLGLCFLLVLVLGLTPGCRQEPEKTEGAPGDTAAVAARAVPPVPGARRVSEAVTLTYYGDSVGQGLAFDQQLAARFEQDTGIQVRVIPRAGSASEAYANYLRLFQARSTAADVLTLDVIWPGAFAQHLRELGGELATEAQKSFPEIVRNNTVEGKLVAMPWFTDAGLLYYRTDLLKQYGFGGPPATWEELERMAKTIQAGERQRDRRFVGYVWQGAAYEGLTCNALEWQVSHGGGEIFHAETGEVNLATPETIAAFKRAAGWVGTISPVGVTTYREDEARMVFQGGNAAFMRNWPYAYAVGNSAGSPIKGKFEVTMLPRAETAPRSASTLGGWQLGISRYTRHPAEAEAFVRYMGSVEVQRWRALEGSYLPTVRSLYDDPELQQKHPFFKTMPGVLESAVARPSSRTRELYNEVSTIYYQGVAEILQGGDPKRLVARMQRDVDTALD